MSEGKSSHSPGPLFEIGTGQAGRWLCIVSLAVVLVGLLADFIILAEPNDPRILLMVELFNPDREMNFFTWYSTALLLVNALLLFVVARMWRRRDRGIGRGLAGLGGVFLLLSLDEMASLHERIGRDLSQFLLGREIVFVWILPGVAFVAVLAAVLLPVLWRLPRRVRWWMVLSGVLYVAGAVGLEAVGWYVLQGSRAHWAFYLLTTWAEESLEIAGQSAFLYALLLAAAASGQAIWVRG